MDYRIGRVDQSVVVGGLKPELRRREISTKYPDFSLQVIVKLGKRHVQLKSMPKPQFGIAPITSAHQQIQGGVVPFQQIGGDMRPYVPGPTGQEYCHVAPFVPVFMASPFSVITSSVAPVGGGICSTRGSRASSGRPSISGYVHRRNAGI